MRKYTLKQGIGILKRAHAVTSPYLSDVIYDGRSVEETVEFIRNQGTMFTAKVLRNSIIGGLEIRTKKRGRGAENVIIIGCAVFGTAIPLLAYCRLLQRLGVDYTFLMKEHCCGAPLLEGRLGGEASQDEVEQAYLDCKEFIGLNVAMARELGAKNMIYMCMLCYYLARRFYGDSDIGQLYFADVLVDGLKDRALAIKPQTVAYFQGGQHRKALVAGEVDWDADWPGYRRLLDRVEGLTVVDLPTKYCCLIARDKIFKSAEPFTTLVTPCIFCYGPLMRNAPDGLRVRALPDILLEALVPDTSG